MKQDIENAAQLNNLRAEFKEKGFAVIQYDDGPIHSYPYDTPWLDDPEFSALYEKIRSNTLVDRTRCHALYNLAQQVSSLPGNILEIGVWRAGTSAILAALLPAKTVFLADTFLGVTKSSTWEHYEDGAHSDTSVEIVDNFLAGELGLSNYEILEGTFPEDTSDRVDGSDWSLVHIDVDVYQSAKDAFHSIWDRVVVGGIVVFDDYGFISSCGGIKRLIDEIKYDNDKLFIHNLNAQAYIIKSKKSL